ncbi:MAG: hypothetical protein E7012_00260 [Alphaproteobacteria bacterium]|nr:hypothetical protein [Alphaproteobacteria bacterium]
MPNILFLSQDDVFKNDLSNQIIYHSADYNIIEDNTAEKADIVIIDEDISLFAQKELNLPIFLFSSATENISDIRQNIHIISKPAKLSYFLDELHSCINRFENKSEGYIYFNRYEVRPIAKEIINLRNQEVTKLTEKEVAIIKYLYKNQDRLVSKNDLLQEVWEYSPDVSTHTIETHIYRLRQKVEHDSPDDQLILTVEGGYRLKV